MARSAFLPTSSEPWLSAMPERGGGVDRHRRRAPRPRSASDWCTANASASWALGAGEVPGLKSVPMATGTPRVDQCAGGRVMLVGQVEARQRQQRRDSGAAACGRPRQRLDSIASSPRRGDRPRVRRAPPPAPHHPRMDLVGVESDGQAKFLRRLQQPSRLARIEHAALAEHVARPCDALRRRPPAAARSMTALEVRLGGVRAVTELRRHGVSAQERGHDLDRSFCAKRGQQGPAGAAPSSVSRP